MVGTPEFKFLKIQIYCTDKDTQKVDRLKELAAGNVLEEIISFGRPDLVQQLKQSMADQINSVDANDNLNQGAARNPAGHSFAPRRALSCFSHPPLISTEINPKLRTRPQATVLPR